MSFTAFWMLLLLLTIVGWPMTAALLWASAWILRVEKATYARAFVAVVVINLLSAATVGACAIWLSTAPGILIDLFVLLPLAFVGIKLIFRSSLGKAVLTVLLWWVLAIPFAVATYFGLRAWIMEAFVIPTGGKATTILGYHKEIACPHCGHRFTVNASREADPYSLLPMRVSRCVCANCRQEIDFDREALDPPVVGGDRLLVAKTGYGVLQRFALVVFKYPEMPVRDGVPMNYVDRLVGLPGETIAIHGGKLYAIDSLSYDGEPEDPGGLRKTTFENFPQAREAFTQGKFQIIRKPPEQLLALARLVHDNDFQGRASGQPFPARWVAEQEGSWKPDNPQQPRQFQSAGSPTKDIAWLAYRHLLPDRTKPSLITDFFAYNSDAPPGGPENWVGDLMLECSLLVTTASGQFALELAKGDDRFQARFELSTGNCELIRLPATGKQQQLAQVSSPIGQPGNYRIRLANSDQRLTLWLDDQVTAIQDYELEKPPIDRPGPTENDLRPACIGTAGAGVTVAHLKLWRDTYYSVSASHSDADVRLTPEAWSDPMQWGALQRLSGRTYYVQPGHYFCLGDNSAASSDSRYWGLVPEKNMLGVVAVRYFPFSRAGPVR